MRFMIFRLKTVLMAAALAAVFAGAALVAGATDAAEVYGSAARSLPIYNVERADNKISISFDCAWGVDYTDSLLQTLEKYNVRATFFAVQFWVEKYPGYVKKISAAGHEVGTHSATHPYMSRDSSETVDVELLSSSST